MNNLKQNMPEDSLVIFTHIPKTAGTSLRHIIQSQFQPQQVFEFYHLKTQPPKVRKGIEKYNQLTEAQKKAIKFISGHVGFGLHEFLPRPCSYITVLRDPVERVVSYYYHLLQKQNNLVKHKTLPEFIQTYGGVHNSMSCYLSGLTLKSQLQDSSIDLNSQQFSHETLKIAKANLQQHFKLVGLVERFDETCILLRKILGWNLTSFYVKKNVTKHRNLIAELPQDTLELIYKFNELDIQLYTYAQENFAEMIKQYGTNFTEDLEHFKVANQLGVNQLSFKVHSTYKRLAYRVYEKLC
ncbi:MAG: sulfotransferase family 2 domain-containing protein [Waterburya sp.]